MLDALRGRTEAWGFGGKDSVRPHYLFLAAAAPFFRAVISEERNSEILAAQIHHLIRKRFYHLSRKIILA